VVSSQALETIWEDLNATFKLVVPAMFKQTIWSRRNSCVRWFLVAHIRRTEQEIQRGHLRQMRIHRVL